MAAAAAEAAAAAQSAYSEAEAAAAEEAEVAAAVDSRPDSGPAGAISDMDADLAGMQEHLHGLRRAAAEVLHFIYLFELGLTLPPASLELHHHLQVRCGATSLERP